MRELYFSPPLYYYNMTYNIILVGYMLYIIVTRHLQRCYFNIIIRRIGKI